MAHEKSTYSREQTLNRQESAIRRRFVPVPFRLLIRSGSRLHREPIGRAENIGLSFGPANPYVSSAIRAARRALPGNVGQEGFSSGR